MAAALAVARGAEVKEERRREENKEEWWEVVRWVVDGVSEELLAVAEKRRRARGERRCLVGEHTPRNWVPDYSRASRCKPGLLLLFEMGI